MVVWVEEAVLDDPLLLKNNKFENIKEKLVTFKWVKFFFLAYLSGFSNISRYMTDLWQKYWISFYCKSETIWLIVVFEIKVKTLYCFFLCPSAVLYCTELYSKQIIYFLIMMCGCVDSFVCLFCILSCIKFSIIFAF